MESEIIEILKNIEKRLEVIEKHLGIVKEDCKKMGNHIEFVEITENINELAEEYIKEKVVGESSIEDCRHIACATINKVDYLISWNFKHVVNVFRIKGYNSINIKNGHIQLDIRSPKEILNNE